MHTPQQALQSYQQHFGEGARVFFSPGRINLLGEHIDYNGGFVLPAAINKGIWFAIAPNNTNTANFVAADAEESFSVELNNIKKETGWQNYVLGVLHILQKKKYEIGGFNCLFGGNVPQGAGLSSSAALEAGLVYSLNQLFGLGLNTQQMALIAQEAEHSFPGTKCGIMDMFASLHGKVGHCMKLDCISLQHEYLPIESSEYELVLINSNVHHSLNDGQYNNRRQQAMEGLSFFQTLNKLIISFRHISTDVVKQFGDSLSPEVYKRCIYITEEIGRTKQAAIYLKENNLIEFGKLMYQTHKGLSELYEVSCSELDYLVASAKTHCDVIGSRMMGGGFGGCTINLVAKKNRDEVIGEIVTSYQRVYNIQPEVYVVETSNGTHEVNL
jgi:galactokinase